MLQTSESLHAMQLRVTFQMFPQSAVDDMGVRKSVHLSMMTSTIVLPLKKTRLISNSLLYKDSQQLMFGRSFGPVWQYKSSNGHVPHTSYVHRPDAVFFLFS